MSHSITEIPPYIITSLTWSKTHSNYIITSKSLIDESNFPNVYAVSCLANDRTLISILCEKFIMNIILKVIFCTKKYIIILTFSLAYQRKVNQPVCQQTSSSDDPTCGGPCSSAAASHRLVPGQVVMPPPPSGSCYPGRTCSNNIKRLFLNTDHYNTVNHIHLVSNEEVNSQYNNKSCISE